MRLFLYLIHTILVWVLCTSLTKVSNINIMQTCYKNYLILSSSMVNNKHTWVKQQNTYQFSCNPRRVVKLMQFICSLWLRASTTWLHLFQNVCLSCFWIENWTLCLNQFICCMKSVQAQSTTHACTIF